MHTKSMRACVLIHGGAKDRIGSDASNHDNIFHVIALCCVDCLLNEYLDNG